MQTGVSDSTHFKQEASTKELSMMSPGDTIRE